MKSFTSNRQNIRSNGTLQEKRAMRASCRVFEQGILTSPKWRHGEEAFFVPRLLHAEGHTENKG